METIAGVAEAVEGVFGEAIEARWEQRCCWGCQDPCGGLPPGQAQRERSIVAAVDKSIMCHSSLVRCMHACMHAGTYDQWTHACAYKHMHT
eukprot:364299-Chlamydomonas_euryale.AAC.14